MPDQGPRASTRRSQERLPVESRTPATRSPIHSIRCSAACCTRTPRAAQDRCERRHVVGAVHHADVVGLERADDVGRQGGLECQDVAGVEPSGGEALLSLPLHSPVEGWDLLFGQRHGEVGEKVEAAVQPRLLLYRRVELAVEAQALEGEGRHGAGDACAPGGVEAAEGQAGGRAADACGLDDSGSDAELREVVGDGAAENAAADDDDL